MSSLRAELTGGGPRVPGYRMLVPAGWEVFDLSAEDETEVLRRATLRLREHGRPDLAASLTPQVREALANLRRQNAFAYAIASEASPTWGLGAASLVGIKRTATPDLTLDDIVIDAVERYGAGPLGDDERIVRWAERRTVTMEGEQVRSLMLNYMIPVPGTRRTQALHWVVNVAHDVSLPDDHESLLAWELLFDTHIASFTWIDNPAEATHGA